MGLRRRFALSMAAVVLVAAAAAPSLAQTPIDDTLSKRDARRLDNIEKSVKEMRDIVFKGHDTNMPVVVEPSETPALVGDLQTKVGDLEQSLTRVNGSLETTAHQLDQARRENAALKEEVKALSDRLTAVEQKQAQAAAAPPAGAAAPAESADAAPPRPAEDPTKAFAAARRLMLSGEYDAAEAAFRDYVANYPDAPRTPEARYWWGKTLAVRGAHSDAATAYIGAIRGWPKESWGADAVVELARELVALKKPADACQALAEMPRHYPKTTSAVRARAASVSAQAKCG